MAPYPGHHLAVFLTLLAIAAASDLGARRVPNWVTVAIASTGVASQLLCVGARGAGVAALAALALGLVLAIPWRLALMGGGDLKLAVAIALWLAPERIPGFLLVAALAGGVVGIPHYLAAARRLLCASALAGSFTRGLAQAGAGGRQVPFGVAIAIGGAAAVLWRWP